jgi:hypothetical protein
VVLQSRFFISHLSDFLKIRLSLVLQPADKSDANGPQRVMAQALMKRSIADIPIVTHIQKESAGMNKLYSQSMCSVKQWKAYQGAEAMVSAEVDEVRAEADEIEPGWSQVRDPCLETTQKGTSRTGSCFSYSLNFFIC